MKKAMLYTITTILVLLSLLTLTRSFNDAAQEISDYSLIASDGTVLRYLEDDIIQSSFSKITGFSVKSIDRSSTNTIRMQQLHLGKVDPSALLNQYVEAISTNYSLLDNVVVNFSNFDSLVDIEPYDAFYSISNNGAFLVSPTAVIESIYINATVDKNASFYFSNTTPSADSSSYPLVTVEFYSIDGTRIYSHSAYQRQDQDNAASGSRYFFMQLRDPQTFQNAGSLNVAFGEVNGSDNSLGVFVEGMVVNVTHMDVEFESRPGLISFENGVMSMTTEVNSVRKPFTIILAHE